MRAIGLPWVAVLVAIEFLPACSSSSRSGAVPPSGDDASVAGQQGQSGAGGTQEDPDAGLSSGFSGSTGMDSDASAAGGSGGQGDSDAAAGGAGGSGGDPLSFNDPVEVAHHADCDSDGEVAVSPGFIYFTCRQTVGDSWITHLFRVPRSALSSALPVTPEAILSMGPEPPVDEPMAAFDFWLLGATDDGAAVGLSGYWFGNGWAAGGWMPAGASSPTQLFGERLGDIQASDDWYFANDTIYEAFRSWGPTPTVRFAGESLPGITPGTHFETELALDCNGFASGANDTHAFWLLDCGDGAQLYGGNVNTSVEPMSEPVVLGIVDNRLFATDAGDMLVAVSQPDSSAGLWSFPTDGGTPMRISEAAPIGFYLLEVSGGLAFGYSGQSLFAIPLDGSATIPVASNVSLSVALRSSLAADPDGAYWMAMSPAGATLFAALH